MQSQSQQPQHPSKKLHPIFIAIIGLLAGVIITLVLFFTGILHFNPYGNDIRIHNFSEFFPDVPKDNRNQLFANLYKIIDENLTESPKVKDATIRADSVVNRPNQSNNTTYSEFIVDIPSLQQSYRGQFTWSSDPDKNSTLTDHNNLVTCLAVFDLAYPSFGCRDILPTNEPFYTLAGKYPILRRLPLNISYYNKNNERVEYTVTYRPTENNTNITLIITDKTGGNLENAINRLQQEGVNTEKTKIEYVNPTKSESTIPNTNQGGN